MLVVITSPVSAATMVAALVGEHVAAVKDEVYTGAAVAAGLFTGASDPDPNHGICFDAGVALTTGAAPQTPMPMDSHNPNHCPFAGIPGPNNCLNAGLKNNTPGSAILAALIGVAVGQTFDAALLSFAFWPLGNTISIQYVFASEEYKEFVGSAFNDCFAIFLNGTTPAHNIALIPGTSIPVSINSVNQSQHSEWFTFGGLNCQYDGYVGSRTPLLATAPCTPHAWNTMVIGVADVADSYYDSGILLKSASLISSPDLSSACNASDFPIDPAGAGGSCQAAPLP